MNRGTCCRGRDYGNQAGSDGLANRNPKVQGENRREQDAASDAGQCAQQAGAEAKHNQE
jgi:hypothetical protein